MADNDDPELRGRLKLVIPGITGPDNAHPDWIRARIVGAGPLALALFWLPPVEAIVFVEADRGGVLRWLGSELSASQVLPDIFRTDYPLRAGMTSPDGTVFLVLGPGLAIIEAAAVTLTSSDIRLGGSAAAQAMILGNIFQGLYNAHTHVTPVGPSGPPIPLLTGSELSTTVRAT